MNALVCLRRMIINQKQARVDYKIGGITKNLNYDRAGFEGSQFEVTEKLRNIFRADSVAVLIDAGFHSTTQARVFAPQAISSALAGFTIDEAMKSTLLNFIMQWPPQIVMLYPMQRYAFQDNSAYMNMYEQYQLSGELRIQNYISKAETPEDETVRLRVLMATYLLGLIAPLNAASERMLKKQQGAEKKDQAGALDRIFNRIRDL